MNATVGYGVSVNFPIAFPNACFSVTAKEAVRGVSYVLRAYTPTKTGVTFTWDSWTGIGRGSAGTIMFFAVGY